MIYDDLDKAEKEQKMTEQEMDEMINEIKLNPDISEQCNQALNDRVERKKDKFEKQKEEQKNKKSVLTELKNIIQKYPQAQIIVNNIENKTIEISGKEIELKNINKKIEDIDKAISNLDPSDKDYASKEAKLQADKAKLSTDKTKIEGENNTLKADRQSERENLKKLLNNPKYNEHIDNLTTRNSLEKNIKNCDRLIRRSENKINDYEQAKESVIRENEPTPPTPPTPPIPVPTKWETFKSDVKSIFSKKQPGDPSVFGKIGKTFKDLFKKQEIVTPPTPPTPPVTTLRDDVKVDKALQYEVVKKYYESMKNEVDDQLKQSSEKRNKEGSSR